MKRQVVASEALYFLRAVTSYPFLNVPQATTVCFYTFFRFCNWMCVFPVCSEAISSSLYLSLIAVTFCSFAPALSSCHTSTSKVQRRTDIYCSLDHSEQDAFMWHGTETEELHKRLRERRKGVGMGGGVWWGGWGHLEEECKVETLITHPTHCWINSTQPLSTQSACQH